MTPNTNPLIKRTVASTHRSLPELFSENVRHVPDRIAVQDDNRQLTFRELDKLSSVMAARLREMGLGGRTTPDHYDIGCPEKAAISPWVMLLTGRTVDVAVGILSVLKSGGAYICVPADAPDAYIVQIAETARITAVLTDQADREIQGIPSLYLSGDGMAGNPSGVPEKLSDPFISNPRDLATAIFTSGSTGRPKGAVLEHCAFSTMLAWQKAYMDIDSGSHTAAFAPFGFIASPWELLFPLATGMTLHILSDTVRKDPLALETYFERHAVRYVFLSPDMVEMFSHNCRGDSLKYIRVAGGPLRSCPRTPYEILYSLGMSENGGSVTFLPIRQAHSGHITLGGAFGPTRIYLLDDDNRLVPPGDIGRMAVSSPSLARGYLGMPERTSECFIATPFSNSRDAIRNESQAVPDSWAYDRIYLSGDQARLDENGMLVHCGRSDFVVKIRGMRVDPGHVETVMAGCDMVRECVVTAKTTPDGSVSLRAWAAGSNRLNSDTLKNKLTARLPDYMVPERIMILDALPRGVHGKVERSRLPDIPVVRQAAETLASVNAPLYENPRLERLCEIFSDILLVPRITPRDNFFALGGDSIKLVRLQLMLRSEFSADLAYGQLFRRPWPAAVLELMDQNTLPAAVSQIPEAPPRERYPLTMPMRQMYLLWRLGKDPRAYEVDTCMMVEGNVNGQRLEAAFAELVNQAPLLRSQFIEEDGEPAWVIDETVSYTFHQYDANDPEQARQLWEQLSWERLPIDLSRSPLFFVVRIRITPNCSFLGLTTHHILVDAASSRLLMDAWWDLYTVGKIQDPGGGQTAAMTDYVLWDRNRRNTPSLTRAETYWQNTFNTPVPLLNLQGAAPRPPALNGGSASTFATLEKKEKQAFTRLAEDRNATVFQVMLSIWSAFLSRQSDVSGGFDEFVMGIPFVGRDHPALQFCLGMFVRTLPLRFRPEADGSQSFSQWLDDVRDLFLNAWEHQTCPLERIVQLVKPPRIPGRSPLFDVMINRLPQPRPFPEFRDNGQVASARVVPGFSRPSVMFDLILEIREDKDRVFIELKYARDLFSAPLMQSWVNALAEIVGTAASDPGICLRDLPWPDSQARTAPGSADTPKTALADASVLLHPADRLPDDPAALALIRVWQEVLETETPGPEDDFFELGGNSISAMRLEAGLFNAGWYLPATAIYEQARLGGLLSLVEPIDSFDDEGGDFA